MSSRYSISILGCGWLGLPLAKSLVNAGVRVKGSTTSPEKLPLLASLGIEPYLVHSLEPEISVVLADFLNVDVLVIAVPPGRTPSKQEDYFRLLNSLTTGIDKSSIRKLIFISSTSVYGEKNQKFSEKDNCLTDSESGRRMLEAELLIASHSRIKVDIVRLAGLIGPGRHPGRFFAGKKEIPNGLAPVNLIHQQDAIGIITELIANDHPSGIYNACVPDHPTRSEFYSKAAQSLGLDVPGFLQEKRCWKIVSSEKVERELKYRFQVPALLSWLSQADAL